MKACFLPKCVLCLFYLLPLHIHCEILREQQWYLACSLPRSVGDGQLQRMADTFPSERE